jgi:tRNA threonylcarbamoyladenosine biosynthesis protein TsaB
MRVLAIDTSFEACSAALAEGEQVLWRETRMIGRGHSEVLPVMASAGLASAGLTVRDLDRIGVVVGPGAFAGVRVGLAFARGLCLGTKARAVGVTSLTALAASVGSARITAPVFDARRGQVYAALFDASLRERIAPFVASPEAAAARLLAQAGGEPLTLAGSGAGLVAPFLRGGFEMSEIAVIDPDALARLTLLADAPASPPAPLYLRPPDAAPPRKSLFAEALQT